MEPPSPSSSLMALLLMYVSLPLVVVIVVYCYSYTYVLLTSTRRPTVFLNSIYALATGRWLIIFLCFTLRTVVVLDTKLNVPLPRPRSSPVVV